MVGYIALFIALGGVAYALEANSVRSKHIKDGQVRTADVADDTGANALTGADIADNSLTGGDVALDALNGDDIDEDELFNDDSLDEADVNEFSLNNFNPAVLGPRRYARLEVTGDVTEADSKDVGDADVSLAGGGYCLHTDFDVDTIVGVVEGLAPTDRFVVAYNQGGPPCAVSDDAMAFVYDVSAASFVLAPIYIQMN